MTEKGCDSCYYSYFDERAYPCSLCIRGIERTDQWQPSKKTKADRKTEPQTDYERGKSDAWKIAQMVFDSTVTLYEAEDVAKQIAKTEPQKNCETCKWGEWYRKGYDITMMSDECGGCCSWNNKWTPKDEPQTDCSWK